jgi:hypothetical protein
VKFIFHLSFFGNCPTLLEECKADAIAKPNRFARLQLAASGAFSIA